MNNINKICDYLVNGENNYRQIGVELEHFICQENGYPATYEQVCECIKQAAEVCCGQVYYEDGYILGLQCSDYDITLEPGCQLEISIKPKENICDIEKIYKEFIYILEDIASNNDLIIIQKGIHPLAENGTLTPDNFPLLPKKRYEYMDEYFKNTGKSGRYMMRTTAATQISIDYSSMEDAMLKMRVIQILSPLFSLLMENQSANNRGVWKKHLIRSQIWSDTDKDRCGYFKNTLDKAYSYEEHAKYIYNKPCIIYKENGNYKYSGEIITKDIYSKSVKSIINEKINNSDKKITIDDIRSDKNELCVEHLLSMFFPTVRLKSYIELRMADSTSINKVLGFCTLVKKIVYNDCILKELDNIFADIKDVKDIYYAETKIMEDGYKANVYGKQAVEWLVLIYNMVCEKTDAKELEYLKEVVTLPMLEYQMTSMVNYNMNKHIISAHKCRDYIVNSTAKYKNRVVKSMYLPKIFTQNEIDYFNEMIKVLYGIFDKVINEFENNKEYRKLFGFSNRLNELILRPKSYSTNIPMARIDIFYNEETKQFGFCEFNTDGSSAMNEDRELNNALKYTEIYKNLSDKYDLYTFELFDTWVDEVVKIYNEYSKEGNKSKLPNVAIVDFMEKATVNEFNIFSDSFEKKGMKASVCDIRDLLWDGEHCYTADGMKIDVIYRRAVTSDIMSHFDEVEDFINAVKNNKVCLIGDFRTQIVHNKILFKVLFLEETRQILTDAENEFVDLHVPYTTSLTTKLFENNSKLQNEVYKEKDKWIIKPEDWYGSYGVHAGVECDEEQWGKYVDECKDKGYILQKFYTPYETNNVDLCNYKLEDIIDEDSNSKNSVNGEYININTFDKEDNMNYSSVNNMENSKIEWANTSNLTGLFVYNNKFKGIYSRISYDQIVSTQYNEMSLPTIVVK